MIFLLESICLLYILYSRPFDSYKLELKNSYLIFTNTKVYIKDNTNNIITIGNKINNLYYLFIKVFKPNNNFINIINYKNNINL